MILHKKRTEANEEFSSEEILRKDVPSKDAPESSGGPPDINVSDLIEQAKKGSDEAFGEIVRLYEKFVFNTACRTLSTGGCKTDDADDIAQDSFIKAWRSLSSFRGDCSFSTWIFRITVNTAKDMMRSKHGSMNTVSLSVANDDNEITQWDIPVTDGDSLPEEAAMKKELISEVRWAIELLPEDQKKVIVMRDLYDLPYSEIASALSIEMGTVKSRISRGRVSLKSILKKGNFFN